jgi:hypothetical protein
VLANNVILFPKVSKRKPEEVTKEEITETVESLRNGLVQQVTSLVSHPLFASLDSAGFTLDNRTMKEGALITEAIKAFILKHYKMDHSFHNIANSIFEVDRHNNVNIVGNLKIKE